MSSISVIIAAGGAEKYISGTIESVLKQSFSDFELIVVSSDSSDRIRSIVASFADKRIFLIEKNDNSERYKLLNRGIKASTGKYFVVLDAGSIMHVDMLKIHYSIMEAYPAITLSGSSEIVFGKKMPNRMDDLKIKGWIELPIIQLLLDDEIVKPTYMVRKTFINQHKLYYEGGNGAEDYTFWKETALKDGGFYIDSQPLVYRRIIHENISRGHRLEKLQAISKIKKRILPALCEKYKVTYPALTALHNACQELSGQHLFSDDETFKLFYSLFMKNKDLFINLLQAI